MSMFIEEETCVWPCHKSHYSECFINAHAQLNAHPQLCLSLPNLYAQGLDPRVYGTKKETLYTLLFFEAYNIAKKINEKTNKKTTTDANCINNIYVYLSRYHFLVLNSGGHIARVITIFPVLDFSSRFMIIL